MQCEMFCKLRKIKSIQLRPLRPSGDHYNFLDIKATFHKVWLCDGRNGRNYIVTLFSPS
jgi:hypothetical protein